MPVCGLLVNNSSTRWPLLMRSWSSFLSIGTSVSCMILAARSTAVLSNGIFYHSGCHVSYLPSVYFMRMVINGCANSGIIHGRGTCGDSLMVRVVSVCGVIFDVSFQTCALPD